MTSTSSRSDSATSKAPSYTADSEDTSAPDWFRTATGDSTRPRSVQVDGATIRYLEWTPARQSRDTLLFVHGGAANAQWWAPLCPYFVADGHRVLAMDLSGMGLSEWRETYGVEQWARDVLAIARHEHTEAHPVALIAHSLGGIIGAHAVVNDGAAFSRFIAVESPVWNHAPAPETPIAERAHAPVRYYPDPEIPIGRFALIPHQDVRNPWYVRHIAWHGLTQTEDGWTWRFDRHIFDGAAGESRIARFEGDLADAGCPCAIVMGEDSYLTPSALEHHLARPLLRPVVLIPEARHHVMLDEPLALVSALRGLLSGV